MSSGFRAQAIRVLSKLRHIPVEVFKRGWAWIDRLIEGRFAGKQGAADAAVAQSYISEAAAIEEAPASLSAHAALYTVLVVLVAAIVWSVFGTLDRIVVAPGKIDTRTPLIVMQPFTTSRILRIDVEPGDHVRKGQVLVEFDPAFAQADVASLAQKVKSLSARVERIGAELDRTDFTASADADPERKTEAQIFDQEMSDFSAEMAQRASRIAQVKSQLNADLEAIAGLRRQNVMAKKEVKIYRYLQQQGAAAPLEVMKAQKNLIDVEIKLQNALGEARKLRERRSELHAERQSYLDKWHSDHNQQLVKARQNLAEASETLNKAQKMREFTDLRAPASGVVLEIADRSVGSVLRKAETLITLVPDGADLYVEANVSSRDIGDLKIGDGVRIKLESYPFQKYGTLDGRLTVLSADSIPLKEGNTTKLVYRAEIALTDSARDIVARGFHIRPGLVASAEIKTGKRTIASYILDPILRTADEGMREP